MGDRGNWSAKLEYDFVKLDDLTFGPGPFRGDTFTASREIQMFKVGLNYRFGRSSAAVTAAPTDQLLCSASAIPVSLRSSGKSPGCPRALFFKSDGRCAADHGPLSTMLRK